MSQYRYGEVIKYDETRHLGAIASGCPDEIWWFAPFYSPVSCNVEFKVGDLVTFKPTAWKVATNVIKLRRHSESED